MKVALYCRVSTEEQRERQSITNQQEFFEKYCSLHNIPTHYIYADNGITGTIPLRERPSGLRLLEDASKGLFDSVLLYKLDRLGRGARHILNAINELESLGVEIKSMTEPFDTSTPSGRFLLTILSGVAELERDTLVERCVAGTDRLAREGAWLGGVIPFGYKVVGQGKDARLRISTEAISSLGLSEYDIVLLIYKLTVVEHRSCPWIAAHFNSIGVPTVYLRHNRHVRVGKTKQATKGIWRPNTVRNIIVSTTYKGVHRFGKRSKKQREVIEREVPAIVDEETWDKAQAVLQKNWRFSRRSAKRQYLLRGLMKCDICGLTYIGTGYERPRPTCGDVVKRQYYVCNGRQNPKAIFGSADRICTSKRVSGIIEDIIWQDIEQFLRNPGEVIYQLEANLQDQNSDVVQQHNQLESLTKALQEKIGQRDIVITLFRKGRINADALDRQLDELNREEEAIKQQIQQIQEETNNTENANSQICSAQDILLTLNAKLDQPLTWELKRQIVEILVDGIKVRTQEENGKKVVTVAARYRFPDVNKVPITTNTDARGAS